MKIILGSSSPRRQQLLCQLGYSFDVMVPNNEELHKPGEPPADYVQRNSLEKASNILTQLDEASHSDCLIITGDTVVALGDDILEKPKSRQQAFQMLTSLSGNRHTVYSGVCITHPENQKQSVFFVKTDVFFKNLTAEEINRYIDSGEPMDKAGSYALQGIGAYMVRKVEGSYSNVIGMPLCELWESLTEEFGVTPNAE